MSKLSIGLFIVVGLLAFQNCTKSDLPISHILRGQDHDSGGGNLGSLAKPILGSPIVEFIAGVGVKRTFPVMNADEFPADLFAASPDLPACGAIAASSRTWVDVIDTNTGSNLMHFCNANLSLGDLFFITALDGVTSIKVVLTDRLTGDVAESDPLLIPLTP